MSRLLKRFRLTGWVLVSFFQQQKKLLIISTVVGSAIFILLRYFSPYLADINLRRQKTRIGIIGDITKNSLPAEIAKKMSYGLITYLPDGSYIPAAAESLTVSKDFLTYTFQLKPGLTWSDGKAVRSNQIEFNIEGVLVSYPDRNKIVFKLEVPFSPFLSLLDKPIIQNNFVGFGPFQVRKIEYKNRLIKSIDIYDKDNQYIYRSYPNEQALKDAFRLGEIDQFTSAKNNLLIPDKDQVNIDPMVKNDTCLTLFFNTKNQLFSDKTIRQALAYAIKDKSFGQPPCFSSIQKDSFAYSDNVKKYEYDEVKAKEFMGSIDQSTELTLATIEDYLPTAEQIRNNWQELFGFKVNIELINLIDPNFQILLLPQIALPDPDQYLLWHSTQAGKNNITQIANPKLDKLLEDGRLEHEVKKRAELYFELQKVLSEELPALFLFHPAEYRYQRR